MSGWATFDLTNAKKYLLILTLTPNYNNPNQTQETPIQQLTK